MKKYLEFKNITTIITSILLTVFGLILGYCTSRGLHLPVTAETLTSITMGLILAVFSYYNAKHQNSLFNEETDTVYIPIDGLTDAQIDAINNYIDNIVDKNLKHIEYYTEDDEND